MRSVHVKEMKMIQTALTSETMTRTHFVTGCIILNFEEKIRGFTLLQ